MNLAEWVEAAREVPPWLMFGGLFLASFAEYVVPPVPGDAMVVAGSVLVTSFGWSPVPLFAAVMAGAIAGAMVDFAVGQWIVRRGTLSRRSERTRAAVDILTERFKRHGAWILALNRFFPGVRAAFFVAAGVAGLRRREVALWAAVSALAWNLLLVGVGVALGENIDALDALLSRYTVGAWIAVAAMMLLTWFGVRRALKRAGFG
ncbi:MAG: VTT domain-containing protein [Deltaproteobacteria bacterium]|nr:VTT domain-containing protein [Deltaproteobacteria bacterium]MCB9787318.1 VTT domain-containing protein [Deltaproteobacteria bacterium]